MNKDKIMERFDRIIAIGRRFSDRVDDVQLFFRWRVNSLSLLEAAFGTNSLYYQEFVKRCNMARWGDAEVGMGILGAAKEDLETGFVSSTHSVTIEDLLLHPRIAEVCRDLYQDGHFTNAVLEASKSLINYVKEKSRRDDLDGADLMRTVFSPKNPILAFDVTDESEQEGMMHLFEGAVLGIRNPRGHDFPDDSPERALEYISFISLLANLVEESNRADSA